MKVYVQVIDIKTKIYQTGMIEEPVINGKEIENALLHFGVSYAHIRWYNTVSLENADNRFGVVEGTTKVVSIVTISD